MKKLIGIVVLALLVGIARGQEKDNPVSSLVVQGTSEISLAPDEVVFNITINRMDKDFAVALDQLNESVNRLKSALAKQDVEEKSIRTVHYNIHENWKYNSGKRYKEGYTATHSLTVHIDFAKKRMKEVYKAIVATGIEVNMNLSFGLKDRKQYEEQLMSEAVRDARRKADVLAEASGVSITGILHIEYGTSGYTQANRNYGYKMLESAAMDAGNSNIDVTPGNIKLTDRVTIQYQLENFK